MEAKIQPKKQSKTKPKKPSKILTEFIAEIKKRGAYSLSKKSGVPKSTIESWIYGKAIPSLTKAEQVADAMDLELLIFDKE